MINSETFIFTFGLVVSAIIMIPLAYAIYVKNQINKREEREARERDQNRDEHAFVRSQPAS